MGVGSSAPRRPLWEIEAYSVWLPKRSRQIDRFCVPHLLETGGSRAAPNGYACCSGCLADHAVWLSPEPKTGPAHLAPKSDAALA